MPDALPPAMTECLAAHAAFMRLGFDARNIYMSNDIEASSGERHVFCILRAQGAEFVYDCGPYAPDDWGAAAGAAYKFWNGSPQSIRDSIYFGSRIYQEGAVELVVALLNKGITPAGMPNLDPG